MDFPDITNDMNHLEKVSFLDSKVNRLSELPIFKHQLSTCDQTILM